MGSYRKKLHSKRNRHTGRINKFKQWILEKSDSLTAEDSRGRTYTVGRIGKNFNSRCVVRGEA